MPIFRKTRTKTFAGSAIPRPDPTCGDPVAAEFLAALDRGEWSHVEGILDGRASVEDREFYAGLVPALPDACEALDAWVRDRPESATAWLVRGSRSVSWAWAARGSDRAVKVPAEAWPLFHERLESAERDLQRAAELAPHDPVPWTLLLTTSRGLGLPQEELVVRFEEGRRRGPQLVGLHRATLQGLCEKWGGSHEAMFDFARRHTQSAPAGSPLHGLIVDAHLERGFAGKRFDTYLTKNEPRDEIRAAADRSVFDPNWLDVPHTVPILNLFAFGLSEAFMSTEARQVGARIGVRRTEYPWAYYDRADSVFARVVPIPG